jgi:hypothetical protein
MHKLYAELEIVSDRTQKNEDNYQWSGDGLILEKMTRRHLLWYEDPR